MKYSKSLFFLLLFFIASTLSVQAAKPGYLELKTSRVAYRGRLVTKSATNAWLMGRGGQLEEVQLGNVQSFKKIQATFRPNSTRELRTALQKELGKHYEIAVSGQYVVAAEPGRAKVYAKLFDELYRSFQRYFSTRGFKIKRPEFPLVAVVYRTRDEFAKCCSRDKFRVSSNLAGYYHPLSNRVALFERDSKQVTLQIEKPWVPLSGLTSSASAEKIFDRFSPVSTLEDNRLLLRSEAGISTVTRTGGQADQWHPSFNQKKPVDSVLAKWEMEGRIHDTIIHEATHQVAYNTGLHRRVGDNPLWVVEGLATMFEPEGARSNSRRGSIMNRVNKGRYLRFGNFVKTRRQEKSLTAFIQNGSMYKSDTLDFYAQAWALSFYLSETRPHAYTRYLKTIAARPAFEKYTPEQRLADFQTTFGKNTDWLETQFLRYMARLK